MRACVLPVRLLLYQYEGGTSGTAATWLCLYIAFTWLLHA